MTAVGPIRKFSFRRFVALLTSRFRTSPPSRPNASESAGVRGQLSPSLDLGDLSVAQFVHDLRNQLMVVMACTDSLVSLLPLGCGDLEVAALRQCVHRSSALTKDLLMAARPRLANRVTVDLNELIASAMVTVTRLVGSHIRLRLRLGANPVLVVAEPLEVERILLNLVLNACDAMPDVSVPGDEAMLTIETAVAMDGPREAPDVPHGRLTVIDTGRGMTAAVRERMFEPFFTTRSDGTGLGLSSVAFTVRQLRGSVEVKSDLGKGTSISVYLPSVR